MKSPILDTLAAIIIGRPGDWLDRHQYLCVAISIGLILIADWVATA